MDDIKLYDKLHVRIFSDDIGTKFSIEKYARLVVEKGKKSRQMVYN
jgi:hypothetical protein